MLPSFSEIPSIITNISHPRRRAVSVGPQSEADAYETLAYREKRRRESLSGGSRASPAAESRDKPDGHTRTQSKLDEYENMMGTGGPRQRVVNVVEPNGKIRMSPGSLPEESVQDADETEMFSRIKKPRVRYDVEVVTKLIVYLGRLLLHLSIVDDDDSDAYMLRYFFVSDRGSTRYI